MRRWCQSCGQEHGVSATGCTRCGSPLAAHARRPARAEWAAGGGHRWLKALGDRFGHDGRPVDTSVIAGRAGVVIALAAYTPTFALADLRTAEVMQTWLYGVYFILHEAGHPLFGLFGDLIGALGGTLMQLLIPLVAVIAALRSAHRIAAAAALWWLGGSLTTVAPYIYDARWLVMPLHGGGTGTERPMTHDWFYVFTRTGTLEWSAGLAWTTQLLGAGLMFLGLIWAARVLWQQWGCRRQFLA